MIFGRTFGITKSRIKRGPVHVIAAILVMTTLFFVVTVFTFIFVQSRLVLNYLDSVPQVTAFFKSTATQQDINNTITLLRNTGLTSSIKYISRDQALAIYKHQNANNQALTAAVTADYTPPSIEVKAKQVQDLGQIDNVLNGQKKNSVDFVVYFSDVVKQLSSFTTGVKNTAIILLTLLLVSLTITSAFITGLQTYVNRDEVEIMRLIGASKSFVYAPFIMEAILYGIISSLLASGIAVTTMPYILAWFSDLFQGIPSVKLDNYTYLIIIGISLGTGIITNLIGSYIAVRKYART